ncbi:MAG: DUF5132 domain-containing protein [Chloroflexota bacterium]|nr:MAG: DUF5132 domain-containing protein [Chloroflexota bacterium]
MSHDGYARRLGTRGALLMGIAGALVGGVLGPVLARATRPVAVGAITQGISIRENVRARVAELREDLDDLVAQARHERRGERPAEGGENRGEED